MIFFWIWNEEIWKDEVLKDEVQDTEEKAWSLYTYRQYVFLYLAGYIRVSWSIDRQVFYMLV